MHSSREAGDLSQWPFGHDDSTINIVLVIRLLLFFSIIYTSQRWVVVWQLSSCLEVWHGKTQLTLLASPETVEQGSRVVGEDEYLPSYNNVCHENTVDRPASANSTAEKCIYAMLKLDIITIKESKMSRCVGTEQMREEPESGIRKWEEMWFKTTAEDGKRGNSDVRWKSVPQTSSCNRKRSVADSAHKRVAYVKRRDRRITIMYWWQDWLLGCTE